MEFRRIRTRLENEALSTELADLSLAVWLTALDKELPPGVGQLSPVDTLAVCAELEYSACLCSAALQTGLSPSATLRISNQQNISLRQLDLKVYLASTDGSARSAVWTGQLDRLKPRQAVNQTLSAAHLSISQGPLDMLTSSSAAHWVVEVSDSTELFLRKLFPVTLLPPWMWPRGKALPEALIAFVLTNDDVVAALVDMALPAVDPGLPVSLGLQAFRSIRTLLADELGLTVTRGTPARIRGPSNIIRNGEASALEFQLLVAACMEWAGWSPLLVWVDGQCPAIGVWLSRQRPVLNHTTDPIELSALIHSDSLRIYTIENNQIDLSRATPGRLEALDIAQVRSQGVHPLQAHLLQDDTPPVFDSSNGAERRRLLLKDALSNTAAGSNRQAGEWAARLCVDVHLGDAIPPIFEAWKSALLDLSYRNPLLNLRQRASSIPMFISDLEELEDGLAAGNGYSFLCRPPAPRPGQSSPKVTKSMMEAELNRQQVFTDLTEKRLEVCCKNAMRAHRSALSEGGLHVLFLALGTLQFTDYRNPSKIRSAPILLLPVTIVRRHGRVYELQRADGDAELNAPLVEHLRQDFGIPITGLEPLPTGHSGVDVNAIFRRFRDCLDKSNVSRNWTINLNAGVHILAFNRFRMWRDLDSRYDDILRHPIVRRLAGVDGDEEYSLPDYHDLDQNWPPGRVLCPLPVDGTQLAAVLAASEGNSLVLQGPPGTGKSQTIANLISHCLSQGQSVLFVSQKKAALDVVFSHLETIGIDSFCLELHSHKASKPQVIEQLRKAVQFQFEGSTPKWGSRAREVRELRDQLNAQLDSLHGIRSPGRSIYESIADLVSVDEASLPKWPYEPHTLVDEQWHAQAGNILALLSRYFTRLDSDWHRLEAICAVEWPRPRVETLVESLGILNEAVEACIDSSGPLLNWFPELCDASSENLDRFTRALELLGRERRLPLRLVEGPDDGLVTWLSTLKASTGVRDTVGRTFCPQVLQEPLDLVLESVERWKDVPVIGWLMLFFKRRRLKRVLRAGCSLPRTVALYAILEKAVELRDLVLELSTSADSSLTAGGESFGAFREWLGMQDHFVSDPWGLPDIDRAEAEDRLSTAREYRALVEDTPSALYLISTVGEARIRSLAQAWCDAVVEFSCCLQKVSDLLELKGALLDTTEPIDDNAEGSQCWTKGNIPGHLKFVSKTSRALVRLAQDGALRDWGSYRRQRDEARRLGLDAQVESLERGETSPGNLRHAI